MKKQIAKARQAESKSNLSTLYSSMEVFKTEFSEYYGDFGAIKLSFTGQMRYDTGFSGAGAKPVSYTGYTNTFFKASQLGNVITTNGKTPTAPTGTVGPAIFTADAHSFIYDPAVDDYWQIDQTKTITQKNDGIQK